MQVLVIDNDAKVRTALVRVFALARMAVHAMSSGDALDSNVLLGRNLIAVGAGNLDFQAVLRIIETVRATTTIPIVCYGSMHWSDLERAGALDTGVDALVDFPFDKTATLVAQVRAVARRMSGTVAQPVIRLGAAQIDLAARTVTSPTHRAQLTHNEATIIARLAADAPNVVPYTELYRALGCKLSIGESRAIKQAIVRLRKKLGEAVQAIEAVPGVGYRLVVEPAVKRSM